MKGIRIGDVGLVTPTGSFDFLFNACLPADHPINPRVLPNNFEVLQLADVSVNKNFDSGTLLLSEHVKQAGEALVLDSFLLSPI